MEKIKMVLIFLIFINLSCTHERECKRDKSFITGCVNIFYRSGNGNITNEELVLCLKADEETKKNCAIKPKDFLGD